MDPSGMLDEKAENRLYIGNLDFGITEATLIKMFSPYGKIVSEDFMLHTRGPKRGEPRGFAFVQFSSKEEAKLAKEKMNGRVAGGRPLVVRLANEKLIEKAIQSTSKAVQRNKSSHAGSSLGEFSRSAKIAAIKSKLRTLDAENHCTKKPRHADQQGRSSCSDIQSSDAKRE